MLLLWVLVLGVCGDGVLSMEGPRGKVTREMCAKPASQVPEEHWPYCCEGYGNHCEDFAASCYLDCQPVVSSGSDVTMVEERPGFCCALYNFCCNREFSRIGNLQKVEAEEQFPTYHRFHVPGKQAPRWTPAPKQNIVRQSVNNDISESPSTVNRIGRTRTPSRNNGPRERPDKIESRSSKSLDDANNDFSDVRRSEPQQNRFNSKSNVVHPQSSSKPRRNQVRFPQRPQNSKTSKIETPVTSIKSTTNSELLNVQKESSIQSNNSFGNIAPKKKAGIHAKNTEKFEEKNVHQNSQQLNKEAENRQLTLNRAGVNRRESLSNTEVNQEDKVENAIDHELTNQPKSVILESKESLTEANPENESGAKQTEENRKEGESTKQPSTRKQNNRRKVMIGRRVLAKTPTKISLNEQESSKSNDLEQIKPEVKSTANRRTLIINRQTPKTNKRNEQENSKLPDISQSRKEVKPTAGRRTRISSRQSSKNINNNEQESSKSNDSAQKTQGLQPTTSRRTISNTRQTGSRRSRPTSSLQPENTRAETNQEATNTPNRSGSRNRGRRIKQTVRRVISDNTQKESVKLPTITAKESNEILPQQRAITTDKSNIENRDQVLKSTKSDLSKGTSEIKPALSNPDESPSYLPSSPLNADKTPSYLPTGPSNSDKTTSNLPSSKEEIEAIKLLLESTAQQIIEDHQNNQNNLKQSEQKDVKLEAKIETESKLETDKSTDVFDASDINQKHMDTEISDKIKENTKEIEVTTTTTNTPQRTRSRSRTTVPISVSSSRNIATPSTGGNSAVTSSRVRSRSRSSSRTRSQVPTLKEESISSSATNQASSRTARVDSFGRKDVRESTVQASPVNTENTPKRITRRRGRQPT